MQITGLNRTKQRMKPALKSAGKFVLLHAVTYGPAGVAGWAVKSVARKPLRLILGFVLEPILAKVMNKLTAKILKQPHVKNPK